MWCVADDRVADHARGRVTRGKTQVLQLCSTPMCEKSNNNNNNKNKNSNTITKKLHGANKRSRIATTQEAVLADALGTHSRATFHEQPLSQKNCSLKKLTTGKTTLSLHATQPTTQSQPPTAFRHTTNLRSPLPKPATCAPTRKQLQRVNVFVSH